MIEIRNLTKQFRLSDGSSFTALSDINLTLNDGETLIVGGANGSGKSLLMKILAGIEKATEGSVKITDRVSIVIQDSDAQILGDTAFEDVAFGLPQKRSFLFSKTDDKNIGIAISALECVGLQDKVDTPAHKLSGGEKRLLNIASAIVLNRNIYIFDEPYSNLDYFGVKSVNRIILKLKEGGKTIIILSHELDRCLALADKFIVLYKGRIVFDGNAEDALKQNLECWGIKNPLNHGDNTKFLWI